MANTRKMKCDCGKYLGERKVEIDHILTRAMVCPSCGFTTLTKDQTVEFRKRIAHFPALNCTILTTFVHSTANLYKY